MSAKKSNSLMDEMGFVKERCPDCGARLYLGETNPRPICLNACALRFGEFRRMQNGLAEAALRVAQREQVKNSLAE